jgi:hypothetical protein
MAGSFARFASATDLIRTALTSAAIKARPRPSAGFFLLVLRYRPAWIERSTSSLGQQSTLRPADF